MEGITAQALREYVEEQLAGSDCFVTAAEVRGDNTIVIEIDSDSRVDLDLCVELNRKIEEHFAPAIDEFDLEVGSAGLTTPLRLPRQYRKNVGNDLEVLTADGRKLRGHLAEADDEGITLEVEQRVKREGEKRPHTKISALRISYGDIRRAVYDLQF